MSDRKITPIIRESRIEIVETEICPHCKNKIGEKETYVDPDLYVFHKACVIHGPIDKLQVPKIEFVIPDLKVASNHTASVTGDELTSIIDALVKFAINSPPITGPTGVWMQWIAGSTNDADFIAQMKDIIANQSWAGISEEKSVRNGILSGIRGFDSGDLSERAAAEKISASLSQDEFRPDSEGFRVAKRLHKMWDAGTISKFPKAFLGPIMTFLDDIDKEWPGFADRVAQMMPSGNIPTVNRDAAYLAQRISDLIGKAIAGKDIRVKVPAFEASANNKVKTAINQSFADKIRDNPWTICTESLSKDDNTTDKSSLDECAKRIKDSLKEN